MAEFEKEEDQVWVVAIWIAFGVFVVAHSWLRLKVGEIRSPGAGFMPFLLGCILLLVTVPMLLSAIIRRLKREESSPWTRPANFGKLCGVMAALLGYAVLLERLGFMVTTFAAMVAFFRMGGVQRWRSAVAYSVAATAISYGLFTYLGVRFPSGTLLGLLASR